MGNQVSSPERPACAAFRNLHELSMNTLCRAGANLAKGWRYQRQRKLVFLGICFQIYLN